ncbi:ATP-NAD kinase-like domain-containing protein [Mucor mucedo]|uniref:ATP-NAD kinase-like domain-containing protein n=1 Tax=Mucor mucedo TaxID=29922 RepID=UPI00221EB817|nr:ATP-NAD kinase-like domain-containing protein [Mucor mucedo]KAI7881730.1 ATP-NAD kinase-like domain-containing protein [Mucor mucedo]
MESRNNASTVQPLETMNLSQKQNLHASHTDRLSDTAEVVREVSKKIGKTKVKWDNPRTVMVITKPGDVSLITMTRDLALWFMTTSKACQGVKVFVDEKLKNSRGFKYQKILQHYPQAKERLGFWTPELCALEPKMFDFIVTLGGDGTVLFASWLFQTYVPPVIPFHLGSLGFLTPFDFDKFDVYLTRVMESGMRVNLRGRLTCTVYRRVNTENHKKPSVKLRNVLRNPITGKIKIGDWCSPTTTKNQDKQHLKKFGEVDGEDYDHDEETDAHQSNLDDNTEDDFAEQRQIPCFTTIPVEKYQVINDLVVDRGPSPYMSLLELFGDDKHLTTVQADGLAISTPTGSTAYSLSANGSLTHPEIRATLITPICPHTLSFRPTLVPDSMELRICVPFNSRNTAWASFDGRGRIELKQGDHIKVTASKYSFPTVCKEDQATDWFNSLSKCLHWNKRQRQKSFAIVESNRGMDKSTPPTPKHTTSHHHGMSMTSMNQINTARKKGFASNNQSRSSSPPLSQKKSPTEPSYTSSSDGLHDEVFAMFIEDDYQDDSEEEEDIEHVNETDFFGSDDSDDGSSVEDGFGGWTDQEIIKARFASKINQELELLSLSKSIK